LLELVERDALAAVEVGTAAVVPVDTDTIEGPGIEVAALFRAAAMRVSVGLIATPVGLPCLVVRISSEDFPVSFDGYACHPRREVALAGALLEAAQSRLTAISGAREDVVGAAYQRASTGTVTRAPQPAGIPFRHVPDEPFGTPGEALRALVPRLSAATGRPPMTVDLTRTEIGIPVFRTVGPRLRYPSGI
jgi:ribosomal protein S12 methylthiotransferase accessory factor